MRKFFRAHRDEDYSQIQYLTAKCTRLSHDKVVLDREILVSQERQGRLQNDLEALTARLLHQEQLNRELKTKYDQLTIKVHQQQATTKLLAEELKELHHVHQKEVRELQQENEGSLRKLQETAEQFEWLCQQQRYWMCCVKRFKGCLVEEREALLRQVNMLEKKVETLKKKSHLDSHASQSLLCPLQDTECYDRSRMTPWDTDAMADLESQVKKSDTLYEELFSQAGSTINGHQKPP
ncbi:hypothetical protein LDENG_00206280 [Lucifuga dentata]|nr:hypothetical protein LDENG_00206280 [Lucifuga dentata]